jgi:hypothetical protein
MARHYLMRPFVGRTPRAAATTSWAANCHRRWPPASGLELIYLIFSIVAKLRIK